MENATEPPEIITIPTVDYPETARKNGVEGTLKAKITLGEDGKARDITILEGLADGVNEAFSKAAQQIVFKPAKKNGKAEPTTLFMNFIVSVGYDESDKNIIKPKLIENPTPAYPEQYRAQKIKGKVFVGVMFYSDKTLKVIKITSVMPKEFDQSAADAAAKIKFEPAVHKKSRKAVGQAVTVVYDFKP